jgi:hypothetical protein
VATSLTIQVLTDVSKAVAGIDSVDKKTSSLGSTMKSVGLAIGGAFSVDKVTGWAKQWIADGMDAVGAMKNVRVAFGDSAEGVIAWGDTAARTFGTTAAEADKMAAKVGIALEGYGISASDAAKMSEALVQRSADIAKVMGTDTESVLAKVETAMRGRTAGLKDYGVQIDKGSSSTQIFNAFMDQTAETAGRSDTTMATFHATMGDLSATLGQALLPVLLSIMPIFQGLADWATNNHAAFVAIVLVITGLALAFGIASTAAGIFAIASLSALWPILAVVAGVAALVAIVVVVIKYWGDLVGWFHTAVGAIEGVISALGPLIFLFGPLGVAIGVVENFGKAWNAVTKAVNAVHSAIEAVVGAVEKAAGAINNFLSHIPHIPGLPSPFSAPAPAGPGVSSYGASAYAAPVTFAPSITITGDIGDPTLAGRRIVAALEAWTAANGRRRIAALAGA